MTHSLSQDRGNGTFILFPIECNYVCDTISDTHWGAHSVGSVPDRIIFAAGFHYRNQNELLLKPNRPEPKYFSYYGSVTK